ncbi:glycosyltransferase family 2 protein [Paenibacillus sp. GCM10027628]|uniref:glycosyltransferase family 2 protein n=1 Tax=Paenibacillus sp. GCM10027628 TaxID=3273413 RepID=UPI0036438350
MNRPLVTVIVPIYNCEKYIEECITSLSNQTIAKQLEIIIIDDGSEDNSFFVAKNALHKSGINGKVLTQSNKGVSTARNVGINHASGYFLTFLDADDTIDQDGIELLCNRALENKSDFAYGGFRVVDTNLKEISDFKFSYIEGSGIDITSSLLKRETWIRLGSFIVSSDLIEKKQITFIDGCKYGEDQEFIVKCLVNTKMVVAASRSIYNYRQHTYSAMKQASLSQFDFVEAMKRIYNYLLMKCPNEKQLLKLMDESIILEAYYFTIKLLASLDIGYRTLIKYIEDKKYDEIFQSSKMNSNSSLYIKLFLWEKNSYLIYKLIRGNYIVKYAIKKMLNIN